MTKVIKMVKKEMTLEESGIPDGSYSGTISGYQAKFVHNNETYIIETDRGVRGLNCPATISIKDGVASVRF